MELCKITLFFSTASIFSSFLFWEGKKTPLFSMTLRRCEESPRNNINRTIYIPYIPVPTYSELQSRWLLYIQNCEWKLFINFRILISDEKIIFLRQSKSQSRPTMGGFSNKLTMPGDKKKVAHFYQVGGMTYGFSFI